jgi:hypothetical protein
MAYVLNVDALKHALVVLKNALEAYPGRVAISEKMDISHS